MNDENMGFDIDLQWFSDEDPIAAPDVATGEAEAPEEGQADSFFSHQFDDGEKMDFATKDDLAKWVKESGLRQSDYTRKSQARENDYRQRMTDIQKKDDDYRRAMSELEKLKSKYDRYEETFKSRPAIQAELEKLVNTPVTPNEIYDRSRGYADEKYSALEEKVQTLEREREEERLRQERDQIYSDLKSEYPDFNEDKISQLLDSLDGKSLKPLIEIIHKASKWDPALAQAKAEEVVREKQEAKLMGGGGRPPPNTSGSTDPKEAHEAALRDMGLL